MWLVSAESRKARTTVSTLAGAAGCRHAVRLHDLPPQRSRLADDRRFRNGGMSQDRRLHLERADAVARALDDVVRAALEPEVAVGIAAAEVTDHHPPPTETLGVARLIVPVPDRVVALGARAHRDLPHLVRSELVALVVDDAHLDAWQRPPHRARLHRHVDRVPVADRQAELARPVVVHHGQAPAPP